MNKILLVLFIFLITGCAFLNKHLYNLVTIKTGEQEVQKRVDEQFQIQISVDHALDVVGVNARIVYDPAIIEPVENNGNIIFEAGDFFPNPTLVVGYLKDNNDNPVPGALVCGCVNTPADPVDGSGSLFYITFKAIASGTTIIEFVPEFVNLQDTDGDIPVTLVNDNVEVPPVAQLKITVL